MSLDKVAQLYKEHGARKLCQFFRTERGYALAVYDFDLDENEPVYMVFGNDTARGYLIEALQGEVGMSHAIVFSTLDEIKTAHEAGQPTLAIIAEEEVRRVMSQ